MTNSTGLRVLITGAAGFIGSHVCERLVKDGWYVIGLDNFDQFYSPEEKRRNLKNLADKKNFCLIQGDICDQHVVDEAMDKRVDVVIHLAAMAGVRSSMEQPLYCQSVNVDGTLRLLDACRKYDVSHVVFASSSSVYGNQSRVPFHEDDPATQPVSVYAATKRAGELLCYTYAQAYQMNITVLRLFTVFGPRQRPDLAICKFTRLIMVDKPIPFFGDGSTKRDYTYIDDIVEGIVLTLKNPSGLRTFNIGSDCPVRLDYLVNALENILGRKAKLEYHKLPLGDVQCTWADLTRSRQVLGYSPKTSLEQGLRYFVQWFMAK